MSEMNAPPPGKSRPPLPEGPFLVVGLARSGRAVAQLLAARGEEVRGVDSGHPAGAAGLEGVRRRSCSGCGWIGTARRSADGRQEPRGSPGGGGDRGGAGAWDRGRRGVGARLAGCCRTASSRSPGPTARRPRSSCLGTSTATAGEPVAVAGNVGTPLSALAGEIDSGRDRRLRVLQLPARGHQSLSRRSARSSSTSPPTTSIATPTSTPTWRRSCGSSPTRATTTSPSTTPTIRRWPGSTSAAAPAGSPSATAPAPTARSPSPRARSSTTASRCWPVAELGLFGEHNVANAMAAAAAALSMGLDRDAVREGLRSFAGVPHRLEQVAEIGGVRFVNDSKATNVASALVGLRAFEGGVHAILGGSEKGEAFAPLAGPDSRALRRLLPDRRLRRPPCRRAGAGGRGRGRAAPLRRPRGRRAPRRRRRASRRGRPALARLRQLRRLRELRTARRALPRDRRGAAVSARAATLGRLGQAAQGEEGEEALPRRRSAGRVQHAAHRDALPARASAR